MNEYRGIAERGKVKIKILDRVSWGCRCLDDVKKGRGGRGRDGNGSLSGSY